MGLCSWGGRVWEDDEPVIPDHYPENLRAMRFSSKHQQHSDNLRRKIVPLHIDEMAWQDESNGLSSFTDLSNGATP